MSAPTIHIVGGGLAGCEAAWQLAARGIPVRLSEMRPQHTTGAHSSSNLAELVCSNSLRGDHLTQAPGVLKRELEAAGSMLMQVASHHRVPAGAAFAVDRERFAAEVSQKIAAHPLVSLHTECVETVPDGPALIATGPLTGAGLAADLSRLTGDHSLYFYDAVAPILDRSTLDEKCGWWGNRRDDEAADYFNIPLNRDEYDRFVEELRTAARVPLEQVENLVHFEGCLPIEEMADRGRETLRFGPLRPIGLRDPETSRRPWAVLQLRLEQVTGEMLNMVGFQTKMRHGEQLRVFRSLPGLAAADFVRLGSMHRNTFLNAPQVLLPDLRLRARPDVWIGGQLSGVEGYIESIAGGLMASWSMLASLRDVPFELPPATTATGALLRYITTPSVLSFQPMNINFGLFALSEETRKRRGRDRKLALGEQALPVFRDWVVKQRDAYLEEVQDGI